jgi:hypothetical protein
MSSELRGYTLRLVHTLCRPRLRCETPSRRFIPAIVRRASNQPYGGSRYSYSRINPTKNVVSLRNVNQK